MALNRRVFLLNVPLCVAGMLGCSSGLKQSESGSAYVELASAGVPSGPGNTILVCMPETTQTKEVWGGLYDELRGDFHLVAVRVDDRNGAAAIREGMTRHRPIGVVLMNNPTVAAYREYQRSSRQRRFPPAVIVMSSFIEEHTPRIVSATGISYEVPLITVVTNLRKLIANRIKRVGVIHRAPLSSFITHQADLARREKIVVVREPVSAKPNVSEIKAALRRLKQTVDVVWILNDNRLLTPGLIAEGWLPALNDRPWVPAIVGAASLVSPIQSFGTFAMLPDHTALGVQAANLLFDLAETSWTVPEDGAVELPLSTTTSMDLVQVRERFALRDDALKQVDRILE